MTLGFKALRFVHPDLDAASAQGPGLQHSPRGGLATVVGEESIRQSLLLLISTRPGERVNVPQYGCDIQRLLFEPADNTTAGLAIQHVRRAVSQWEPRVDIVNLDAAPRPGNPPSLQIALTYRVKSSAAAGTLEIAIPLTGGI
jgi:phage baseplate assembly protein W